MLDTARCKVKAEIVKDNDTVLLSSDGIETSISMELMGKEFEIFVSGQEYYVTFTPVRNITSEEVERVEDTLARAQFDQPSETARIKHLTLNVQLARAAYQRQNA